MNCKHCGSDCNGDIGKEELTTQQWCEFIIKLAQAYNDFRVKIHITGGEPLLRKDFAEIAFVLHKSGFEWGITTNGLLLNDDLRIRALHSMGMKTISLSIDGVAETHDALRGIPGAFEQTMSTLKKLISFGKFKSVQVTTVVNKKNITELPDLYDMFRGIGLRDWRIASVDPIGRAENATDNEMRKYRYTSLGLCGKCGEELQKDDVYCTSCGTKRGDGDFIGHDTVSSAHYPFDDNYFQALYAPPPSIYRYECPNCGTDWNRASQSREGVKYCPLCGSELKVTIDFWR